MAQGRSLANLFRGRWQAPLAFVATVVACVSLYMLRPPSVPDDIDGLIEDVRMLEQRGAYRAAADAAGNLLEMEPPLPQAYRATLHDFLASLIYNRESQLQQHSLADVRTLLEHHGKAIELGVNERQDARRLLRVAAAHDWLGEKENALYYYRETLDANPQPDTRREALSRLVTLLRDAPGMERERQHYLYALLSDETLEPTYVWWGLLTGISDALYQGQTRYARELLTRFGAPLRSADLAGYYQFLDAWVLVREDRLDEAEPAIFWVDEWLAETGGLSRDLDRYGDLAALNQWLLGELELADWRPQTALAAFDHTLALTADDDLFIKASLGRGRALDMLERHATALSAFQEAASRLGSSEAHTRRQETLQATLEELARTRHDRNEYDAAIGYLDLAAALLPETETEERLDLYRRLGDLLSEAVENGAAGRQPGEYHRDAAAYYERASELALTDSDLYHALLWSAARHFDQAGFVADARRNLLRFVDVAGEDPRLAQALLLLGEGCEVEGDYEGAVAWFRRLIKMFPTLEEAARARVYSADCLVAMGEDYYDEAEAALEEMLSGDYSPPNAGVFRDAFLRMCDLLYVRARYADVIGRLETFRRLFPDDPDTPRVTFLWADAYRRSAADLAAQIESDSTGRVQRESEERYRMAAELYDSFLRMTADEAERDDALAAYVRLALFNRGDCLLALNEPATLQEALETYQRAAAQYELEPSALSAQVLIALTHLRLGQVRDAARAVERARWMLRNIPDQTFAERGEGANREFWDRYLTAVATSQLLRDVLPNAQ